MALTPPRTTYRVVIGGVALWLAGLGISLNAQGRETGTLPPALLPVEQAWIVTLSAPPLAGGAMDAERVYLPVGPRAVDAVPQPGTEQILALGRETGERSWARDLRSAWPPAVSGPALFVAAESALHAIDAKSGLDLWQVSVNGPFVAAPVAAGGLVVAATAAGGLTAFQAARGTQVWHLALETGEGGAALAVDGEDLYVSIEEGRLARVRLRDGTRLWERQLPGRPGVPSFARDRVLVGSTDNYLYALDPDDGDVEWRYPAGGDVIGAAAKGDTIFFVARDNVVRALERGSGNQRWKSLLETRAAGPPLLTAATLLVPGSSLALVAFDAATGKPLGMYAAPTDLAAPALVDPDPSPFQVAIVAVMGDGRVAGLRPVQMMFREGPPAPFTALPGRPLDPELAPPAR